MKTVRVHYFREKAPSKIFNWVLNMLLKGVWKIAVIKEALQKA